MSRKKSRKIKPLLTPKLNTVTAEFVARLAHADIVVTANPDASTRGCLMVTCKAAHQSHNFKILKHTVSRLKKHQSVNMRQDKRVFAL